MLIASYAERMQRQQAKARRLLAFLRTELWTVPAVAAEVMQLGSRSAVAETLAGFVKAGWIVQDEIDTPPGRRRLIGITASGQAHIAALLGREPAMRAYERGRVGLATIEHRIQLQRLRIAAARAGWTGWLYPDRQPVSKRRGGHRPDALATAPAGVRVALELERTIKTAKRYRAIAGAHLDAIARGEYSRAIYICPDAARAAAVQKVFQSLGRALVGGREIVLTEEHLSKFSFTTHDQLFGGKK